MTREEYIDFANALKNNYTIDFDKLPEFCDMAISALSTEGEYIKKEETLKALHNFWDECINFDGSGTELMLDNKGVIDDLPTYSFPETAKPEEGAELIDRRQIKWYGCDHEGHIKGINCDTADCSKCFFATVEHDEVMSLPVCRVSEGQPLSENKGEWIDKGNCSYVCSNCKTEWTTSQIEKMCFCPTCGADMRGKSCNACKNNDDEFSAECYECVKGIENHYMRDATLEERKSVDDHITSISTKTGRKFDE